MTREHEDPLNNYTITMSVNAESLTTLIDRLVTRRVKQEVTSQLQHLIQMSMGEENERSGMGSPELRQPVAHDHVPVSENVSAGGGGESGESGGLRLHDGSGDVHPGSRDSEHPSTDGRAPRTQVTNESQDQEIHGIGPWDYDARTNPAGVTPDMMYQITLPLESWAAIVLEHMYEGFATSARGQSAQGAHDYIRRSLSDVWPGWVDLRKDMAWPKKSSR